MHPAAAHLKPFTSESARAAALKGVAIRRKRKEEKIRAQAEENQQRLEDAQTTLPADSYLAKRLARVREQLDRLDAMMLDERDPQKLSWLATCTAKLAEQERVLCGRPNPGQYRPTAPRRKAASGLPEVVPE